MLMVAIATMFCACCKTNTNQVNPDYPTVDVICNFGISGSTDKVSTQESCGTENEGILISHITYKHIPCNVTGFTVKATCGDLFKDYQFIMDKVTPELTPTDNFILKDVYVGANVFKSILNLSTEKAGVAVNTHPQFDLDENGDFDEGAKTDLEAKFNEASINSDSYEITKTGNTGTINLGAFHIVNGGVQIKFTGDDTYKTRYKVLADGADEASAVYVDLNVNQNKALIINNADLTDAGCLSYNITVQVAYDGINYEAAEGIKPFTVNKAKYLILGASLNNYSLVVKELKNIQLTIEDFEIIDGDK